MTPPRQFYIFVLPTFLIFMTLASFGGVAYVTRRAADAGVDGGLPLTESVAVYVAGFIVVWQL